MPEVWEFTFSLLFYDQPLPSLQNKGVSPLFLKSFLGALPKAAKSSGMLNEKAIGDGRAESRVPQEQNTRDFVQLPLILT